MKRQLIIKDVSTNQIHTKLNSLKLITDSNSLALAILQVNYKKFLKEEKETQISKFLIKNNINFEISFSSSPISKNVIKNIIKNDKSIKIKDIQETYTVLEDNLKNIKIYNGSALIVDYKTNEIKYIVTSGSKLFKNTTSTINQLKEYNFKIFIASGDTTIAIKKLTKLLKIPENHGYSVADSNKKEKIVKNLKKEYEVIMVGDGLNDVKAFKTADISILTLENKNVSKKLLNKTDYEINEISEIVPILLK